MTDQIASGEAAAPVAPASTRSQKQTSFAADVLKLVSGTAVAQGIGVLATPLLTRLYGPEAFGTLALFTSITSIIGVVACLRYELAIMLPESDEEAANLLAVSLLAVVGVTLLTVPIVTWGRPLLLRVLRAPELGPYLWAVPVAVLLAGIFQAGSYWVSRQKRFGRLSVAKVANTGVAHAAKLAAGLAGRVSAGMLIGGAVLGSGASAGMLCGGVWRRDRIWLRGSVRLKAMWRAAVRYLRFASVDVSSALLNTVSTQLPTILLSAFFDSGVVGRYALGHRVLSLPMGLVGASLGQVFYQRASAARVNGTLSQVVEDTTTRLVSVAAFPFILLAIVSPDLFGVVFGAEWYEAGVYAQILTPWLLFVFLGSPMSTLYCVMEKQQAGLVFNVALLITRAGALAGGGLLGSGRLALGLFAASGAVLWAGFCAYLFHLAGLRVRRVANVLLWHIAMAMLFALPLAACKVLWSPGSFMVLTIGAASTIAYYAWMLHHNVELRDTVGALLAPLLAWRRSWQRRERWRP